MNAFRRLAAPIPNKRIILRQVRIAPSATRNRSSGAYLRPRRVGATTRSFGSARPGRGGRVRPPACRRGSQSEACSRAGGNRRCHLSVSYSRLTPYRPHQGGCGSDESGDREDCRWIEYEHHDLRVVGGHLCSYYVPCRKELSVSAIAGYASNMREWGNKQKERESVWMDVEFAVLLLISLGSFGVWLLG